MFCTVPTSRVYLITLDLPLLASLAASFGFLMGPSRRHVRRLSPFEDYGAGCIRVGELLTMVTQSKVKV